MDDKRMNRSGRIAELGTLVGVMVVGWLGGCQSSGVIATPAPDPAIEREAAMRLFAEADAALFESPYDAGSLADRARAFDALGMPGAALADAEAAVALGSFDSDLPRLIERSRAAIERERSSQPAAENPTTEEPATEPVTSEMVTTAEAATTPVDEAASEAPTDALDEAMAAAELAIADEDHDVALAALATALELEPGYTPALERQAFVLGRQGRYAESVAVYDEIEGPSPASQQGHAYALIRTGQHARAVRVLDELIAADGGSPDRLLYRGLARLSLGDSVAAEDLQAALELGGTSWASAEYARSLLDRLAADTPAGG